MPADRTPLSADSPSTARRMRCTGSTAEAGTRADASRYRNGAERSNRCDRGTSAPLLARAGARTAPPRPRRWRAAAGDGCGARSSRARAEVGDDAPGQPHAFREEADADPFIARVDRSGIVVVDLERRDAVRHDAARAEETAVRGAGTDTRADDRSRILLL